MTTSPLTGLLLATALAAFFPRGVAHYAAGADRHPLFLPAVAGGGLLFAFGLGLGGMARPEVVLSVQ